MRDKPPDRPGDGLNDPDDDVFSNIGGSKRR